MKFERIKLELSEKALELEMKERNPLSCRACQAWQAAGDMGSVLNHCEVCGAKEARSDIKALIIKYAEIRGILYEQSWDIANDFLNKRRSEVEIYFDEDYFYSDLKKYLDLEKYEKDFWRNR